LALFGARQPPALCSLLESLLRLLCKLIGAFLTLLHAPLPLSLSRLQNLQTPLLRRRQLPLLRTSLQTLL